MRCLIVLCESPVGSSDGAVKVVVAEQLPWAGASLIHQTSWSWLNLISCLLPSCLDLFLYLCCSSVVLFLPFPFPFPLPCHFPDLSLSSYRHWLALWQKCLLPSQLGRLASALCQTPPFLRGRNGRNRSE